MRTGYPWLAGFAWAALACSGDGNGPSNPGDGDGDPQGDIIVANFSFTPATFNAALNQTVVWEWNSGGTDHNIVFDDGNTSGVLGSGTYSRTFTVAGSFPYLCTIHGSGMSGTVNVATSPGSGGGGGGGGGGYGNP